MAPLILVTMLAGCSGGSDDAATTAPDQADQARRSGASTDGDGGGEDGGANRAGDVDLTSLSGTWRVGAANARVLDTAGFMTTASITAAIEGTKILVEWSGTQDGAPRQGSSTEPLLFSGEVALDCAKYCEATPSPLGPAMGIAASDGRLSVQNIAMLTPPTTPCFDPPAGAWVVTARGDDQLQIAGVVTGGSGGADGCADSYMIGYDLTLTRSS